MQNEPLLTNPVLPMVTTRYQGSKRKLLDPLHRIFAGLSFHSALDAFGGTGSVTHLLLEMGKSVQYNDILPANTVMAQALFSPGPLESTASDVLTVFQTQPDVTYASHIAHYYGDIYFTDAENQQLDVAIQNILSMNSPVRRAELLYCLFQATLSKRPYNLFHRANLTLRQRNVERRFGNKTTWDRSFADHMVRFHRELGIHRKCRTGSSPRVTCASAFSLTDTPDLVYFDTPYARSTGAQESNYFNFYHFLDALLVYVDIPQLAIEQYAHRPIYEPGRSWYPQDTLHEAFRDLFQRFRCAQLVISYRSDGCPTPTELKDLLMETHASVHLQSLSAYRYVLSSRKTTTEEIVLVASEPRTMSK